MNLNQIMVRKAIIANSLHFFERNEKLLNELKDLNFKLATIKTNEYLEELSRKEIYYLSRKIKFSYGFIDQLCKDIGLNPICEDYKTTIKHIVFNIADEYINEVH